MLTAATTRIGSGAMCIWRSPGILSPPVNLHRDGAALVWEKPGRHAEIQGFRLYRSEESGRNYERVGEKLLTETRYPLPPDPEGCYVLTSVEYSGLESRMFSNEASIGGNTVFRHFYRPAAGRIAKPMVPYFEPAGAGDAYAVAITDPDSIYKKRLEEGLSGSVTMQVTIPEAGPVRILARVRGMSALERSTYTNGMALVGRGGQRRLYASDRRKRSGSHPGRRISMALGRARMRASFRWLRASSNCRLPREMPGLRLTIFSLPTIPISCRSGRGQVPENLAAAPEGLRVESFSVEDERTVSGWLKEQRPSVKLAWQPVAAPQGVSHYNVYRSDYQSTQGGTGNAPGQSERARLLRRRSRNRADGVLPRPRRGLPGAQPIAGLCQHSDRVLRNLQRFPVFHRGEVRLVAGGGHIQRVDHIHRRFPAPKNRVDEVVAEVAGRTAGPAPVSHDHFLHSRLMSLSWMSTNDPGD